MQQQVQQICNRGATELRLPMPALSHTAADGEPQVARPSLCRRRRSRTHELPPSPRPAAALPLPPAVG